MSGALTAVAALGVVGSIVQGQQQKKAAASAARQAKDNADRQAKMADEEMNRANQKRANSDAALDAAMQSGKAGVSGTMLTGSQGVDAASLSLGKNSLLGS